MGKRTPTQRLPYPWPFLLSVVEGRGIVRNVTVPRKRVTKGKK